MPVIPGEPGAIGPAVDRNTARYLLEHPELDASWEAHARSLIAWIETNFGKPLVYGTQPIAEQTYFDIEMGSHTSRYGAVNALLYERTGGGRDPSPALDLRRPERRLLPGPHGVHDLRRFRPGWS